MSVLGIHAQNATLTPIGAVPPKLTYEAILALVRPEEATMIYDITYNCLRIYTNGKWLCSYQVPGDTSPNIAPLATVGGSAADQGQSIAVDGSGNVYVTGYYQGTAAFSGTSNTGTTKPSVGGTDIFIAKYNPTGALQWVQSAGGTGSDAGYGIAVDGSGNVYVTGAIVGTANFSGTSCSSAGGTDIFIAKYTTDGTFQWVQSAGGLSGNEIGIGIAVDGSGNAYITGLFSGNFTFAATPIISAGNSDLFIAKYNTAGIFQWVQTAGGTDLEYVSAIAVDGSGKVYITGYFLGTTTFGGTSLPSAGTYDIFIAKYDPVGTNWAWAKSAGGTKADLGNGIAVDGSGNVYVTGSYQGTAAFSVFPETATGGNEFFIAKYTTDGNYQWVQSSAGTGSEEGLDVVVDGSGNAYITGTFSDTGTFNGFSKGAAGSKDIFIAKYTTSGHFQWVQFAGGAQEDKGLGIAVDGNNNVYATGYFSSTATFGRTAKTSAGDNDVFIMRVDK